MARKLPSSRSIDEAVTGSVNFELSLAALHRRSERRAWLVAGSAIGLTLILAGGYFLMLPLKQQVPYLVMADAYTGTSTLARLSGDPAHRRLSTSEAINRSNVAHYVMARESYDLAMLKLGDWATVQTMSAPGVKAAHAQQYSPASSTNLVKVLGKDTAIRVRLLSIVLLGGGADAAPKGATVRFQRSLYDKQSGLTRPLDNKIATLEFAYKANLQMDEQSRIANPLGFWVTDYRVDNDYASAPPPEITALPQSAPSAGIVVAGDDGMSGSGQLNGDAASAQAEPGAAAATTRVPTTAGPRLAPAGSTRP
ncbi:MAG: type IV secretion system protein [Xanthomonadales bacterium]|nr:type IV secretion system protein [Xanthomonadales bacterium]